MAHAGMPRMISGHEVEAVLKYEDLIPTVEQGLGNFSKGERGGVVHPQRTLMGIKEQEGHFFAMPVYSAPDGVIATKLVSLFPNNAKDNLSTHMAIIVVNDVKTGAVIAVMDGEHITGMRTAAASAVATKYLAKDGSKILAILGAGTQAHCHVEALRHVMNSTEIRVWTRSFEKAQAFAQKFGIKACKTAEEAVRGADVITTCTLSKTPILKASWIKKGAHINCVGAPTPDQQELGPEVMRSAIVYGDSYVAAMKESGDVIHSKVEVFAEIGELVNGTKEAKRNETTIFKSQGLAIEDAVSARLVYDKVVNQQSSKSPSHL